MRHISILMLFWLFGMIPGGPLHAAGEIIDGKVSTFLVGKYLTKAQAQTALESQGFSLLSAEKVDKKGELTTLVFTSPALTRLADKPGRGFAAVLRLLVNGIDKEIAITNPLYFLKAYLQDDFDEAAATRLLEQINAAFPNLKNGKDALEFTKLPKYHFMVGMPYYGDTITVGKGEHRTLLEKAQAYRKGKNILFTLKLDDQTALLGYTIGKRTAKFVKKIGTHNAAVLPYVILIEKETARILDPKYYLALNYPSLSMSEFMTIATVPGAIEKDCKKPFK